MSIGHYPSAVSFLLVFVSAVYAFDSKRDALWASVRAGDVNLVQAVLAQSKVSQDALDAALHIVSSGTDKNLKEPLEKAGAKTIPPASETDRKNWAKLAGTYESDGGGIMTISVKDVGLI